MTPPSAQDGPGQEPRLGSIGGGRGEQSMVSFMTSWDRLSQSLQQSFGRSSDVVLEALKVATAAQQRAQRAGNAR